MITSLRNDWRRQAACSSPMQLVFTKDIEEGLRGPEARAQRDRTAVEICAGCPVRHACLEADLQATPAERDHWFVRGGMTAAERDELRAARAMKAA